MLHLCPDEKLMELWQSVPTKYMLQEEKDKPTCPLCLLAMSQIYEAIKNNRTEVANKYLYISYFKCSKIYSYIKYVVFLQKNIEDQLDKLCVHLPHSLVEECTDLVKGYSKEIIELLLADLTPQEVCVYIKLCDASKNSGLSDEFITDKDGEICM